MPTTSINLPGALTPQEMLVAEAIQMRAWGALALNASLFGVDEHTAKARLADIVVRLMSDRSRSIGDLAAAAVVAFNLPARD